MGAAPADRAFLAALAGLAAALRELDAPAMIIGGVAVIARGVPRQTIDIDATVWAEAVPLDRLVETLGRHDIVPRVKDAVDFARKNQVLLLQHESSGTPIEVSLAWLPFEREALARAETLDFGGVDIAVARPEDLVIYKTIAWRERDRTDVERLLILHGRDIDIASVRSLVVAFVEVLGDPGRLAAFDAIVRRALG